MTEEQRSREFRAIVTFVAAVIAAITFIIWISAPVRAETSPDRRWFVQVWFDAGITDPANPDADPGRVEVSIAGQFVGCALAPFYRPTAGEVRLVPLSLGFLAIGRREDIKVEVHGELRRLAKPTVKITEAGR